MRVILAGTAITVLVVALFLARPGPVARLDDRACDLLTGWVGGGRPSGRVEIVEIDEQSLAQYGGWPWPRDLLGRLIRDITDNGAAAAVLDMALDEQGGAKDRALADALAGRPVVLGYAFRFDGDAVKPSSCELPPLPLAVVGPNGSWGKAFFHARSALCSPLELTRAAVGSGFLNAAPDSDGRLRRIPVVMEYGDQQYPSLALAAISLGRRAAMQLRLDGREATELRMGDQVIRLEGASSVRLRFRGPRRTFPYLSATRVLNGSMPAGALQGKIVIVGGSALGLPNPVATPADPLFPDVEVEATAIDNLLQGDSFNRPADFELWELALALAAGVAASFLMALVRSWWSAFLTLVMAGATWAGCAWLLSRTGLLLSPLPVTAALALDFPAITLLNYRFEKRRAERFAGQLAEMKEQSREALHESEARYRRLVENVNDAIIVDDFEGRLVFANRRFREWFGLEENDIRGIALDDFVAPEWREALRDQRAKRMSGADAPGQYEFEAIRPDGARIWIEALVTNVEEDGRISGTQAALRDVTVRKRIEAQYLQSQKMDSIGRLAGVLAHDFNNMLTVINGYCDFLLAGPAADEADYRAILKEIRTAGERAAELTRNLLAFSRKQPAQPKPLDLNLVVSGAERMFGRLAGEDVKLITRLSPALGEVMADGGQIHQVLVNLLVNARDAMPLGGTVIIETKNVEADAGFVREHPEFEPGSYVRISVTDTGTGMSDEVKRRLFEPFFTTKEPGRGTGLGLATIYGIVQQNGGKVAVTTKLAEGTAFHIYLPRVTAGEAEEIGAGAAEASLGEPRQGSGTVLVVEDQETVRQYVRIVLEGFGYRVLAAADAASALTIVEQFPGTIDLLVTDLVLPLMNGRDLAGKLKTMRPGIGVVFMSGYPAEVIDARGIIAGDLVYLSKPFSPEELGEKVRDALANPAAPGSGDGDQKGRSVSGGDS